MSNIIRNHYLNTICPSIWINGRGKSEKKIASMRNLEEFDNWFNMLSIEAKNCRWDIKNVPDTCNKRVIKESMLINASVTFFDKADYLLSLPGLPTQDWTLYGDPTSANVHGRNGFNETIPVWIPGGESPLVSTGVTGTKHRDKAKAVWIRENFNTFPFINICAEYAYKISNTMRTLDTTVAALEHPYIVVATEDTIEEVKDYFKRRNNHEQWIDVVSAGIFDANKVNVVNLDMTEAGIRDCTETIEWYLQMFRQLEFLDGAKDVDKKAEISIPELRQGDNIVKLNAKGFIAYLEEQFDNVNKFFGTNMKPYLISDEISKEDMQNEQHKDTENISGTES